jgi:hypothetical protein
MQAMTHRIVSIPVGSAECSCGASLVIADADGMVEKSDVEDAFAEHVLDVASEDD